MSEERSVNTSLHRGLNYEIEFAMQNLCYEAVPFVDMIPQHSINYVVRQAYLGPAGGQSVVACVGLRKDPELLNGFGTGVLLAGLTPLGAAARSGCESGVAVLLNAGADPNLRMQTAARAPPIVMAVSMPKPRDTRSYSILRHLIEFGADVNATDIFGRSALHYAAKYDHKAMANALIRAQAFLNLTDNVGFTPLLLAAKYNSVEVVDALVSRGANLHAKDNNGFNLLLHGALNGNADIVEYAIKKGFDCDCRPYEDGPTPTAIAAREGYPGIICQLHAAGASMNACCRSDGKYTPLHEAAAAGEADCVFVLLERSANVGALDGDGRTPLHHAATHRNVAATQCLIEFGADVSVLSHQDVTPAMYAAHHDAVAVLRELHSAGDDLLRVTHAGDSALAWAAVGNAPGATALLLELGASPNVLDDFGQSPLHHASETGAVKCIELLLQHGANPNFLNSIGEVPLHEAIRHTARRRSHAMKTLLRGGADPNISICDYPSPFSYAMMMRCFTSIKILSFYGGRCENVKEQITLANIQPTGPIGKYLLATENKSALEVRFMMRVRSFYDSENRYSCVPRLRFGYVSSQLLVEAATKKSPLKAFVGSNALIKEAMYYWRPLCSKSAHMFFEEDLKAAKLIYLLQLRLQNQREETTFGKLARETVDHIVSFVGAM